MAFFKIFFFNHPFDSKFLARTGFHVTSQYKVRIIYLC